jgi:hypothetical protein
MKRQQRANIKNWKLDRGNRKENADSRNTSCHNKNENWLLHKDHEDPMKIKGRVSKQCPASIVPTKAVQPNNF